MTVSTPLGLIAGSGRFPLDVAREAIAQGRRVVCAAHEGEADPALEALCETSWIKLGQLGRIAELLRAANCTEAVFAGGITKVRLFGVRPDWLGLKTLTKMRSFGDDAALRAIADALEGEGIKIVSPLPFCQALLAPRGVLTKRVFTEAERRDAEVGRKAALGLGALDLGQTVIVQRGVVLAVEAIEGTDACIARGGELSKRGRRGLLAKSNDEESAPVVVKLVKPGQDERFDLPAVGPRTIETMSKAGCEALCIEAGKTLLLEREELLRRANKAGIAIEAI